MHTRMMWVAVILVSVLQSSLFADRPNIIVIMADDIGFECYSCYGSQFYSTPNIDSLAKHGVRFRQAYSQPICTPSRVKIMTGRYNLRNYTTFGEMDLSQPTFAKMVKEAGYATAIAGKWQLSARNLDGPYKAGFDEYCLWHFSAGPPTSDPIPKIFKNKGSRYKSPKMFRDKTLVAGTENKYGPDVATDYICDFIERKKDKPFLVYYPMILVHSPFEPTPDSADWESKDPKRKPVEHFREMVSYMDKVIGRIVEKLEATGLREKTLILVTGDNGTNRSIVSPFPGRGEIQGGKGSMTDAGTRVAFVASWPGNIKSGSVVDAPIDFADILPTIADATGATIPEGTDGQSFLPLLKGDSSKARDWVFMSYSKNGTAKSPYLCFVRNKDWKLYSNGDLFNIPNDWNEEKPVAKTDGEVARAKLQPVLDKILKDVPKDLVQRN